MGIIKVSHLKPGALLSRDVKDCNGRLLVPAGTTLTEKHIRVIKIWGVIEVDIEAATESELDIEDLTTIDPERLLQAEEHLRDRFRFCDLGHPAIEELFRIGRLRLASRPAHPKPPATPSPAKGYGSMEKTAANREERFRQITELIRTDLKLTTLPAVFKQINETILNPNSSSREIADLISKDTALSARLLKLVNSVFYSYPSQIDSLSQAVSIVGINQLSVLAFGIDVVAQFKKLSQRDIDMDAFWTHSIACGVIARLMAFQRNIQNTERLFVAGILHDVGRLLLYHYKPNFARDILTRAREKGELLHVSEAAYLGVDHSQIGALLLQVWKLPQSLENAVRYHHAPAEAQSALEPAIIHCADVAAMTLEFGSTGDYYVTPLDPLAWKELGFSVNVLEPLLSQADRQVNEIFQFFNQ